ncbi:MAG: 30S ribosome-binding factor RbfA [Planctomycetota bacterium]|jgi:ribosome-binding factor A
MNERRIARIQSLIKARVAKAIDQELSDPRCGMITVTRVEVDRELDSCVVYWSVLGDENARRLNESMLEHAAPYFRREIAAALRTRTVPKVKFAFDEGVAGAIHMENLLSELREEREQAQGENEGSLQEEGD